MTKAIPLTIPNIISAMKEAGFVTNDSLDKRLENVVTNDSLDKKLKGFATKDDLKGFATKDDLANGLNNLRKQINDDQFEARAEFYQKMTKTEIDRIAIKIDKLDDKISSKISSLKDDLTGLNAEFSTHHHAPILEN